VARDAAPAGAWWASTRGVCVDATLGVVADIHNVPTMTRYSSKMTSGRRNECLPLPTGVSPSPTRPSWRFSHQHTRLLQTDGAESAGVSNRRLSLSDNLSHVADRWTPVH